MYNLGLTQQPSSETVATAKDSKSECDGIASVVESLIDTSTLAAAIAEPEEFVEDYCSEKRVEKRRPKLKHRANCKEKTITCMKRTCVYMLSYVGLTCIVVAYSILGGIMFRALEEANEELVEQEAVRLRENFTKELERKTKNDVINNLQPVLEHLKALNENASAQIEDEIGKNVRDFKEGVTRLFVNIMEEVMNQTDRRFAQKQVQHNATNLIKSKKNEINDLLNIDGKALVDKISKYVQTKMESTSSSLRSSLYSDVNTSKIIDLSHTFQLDTYNLVNKEGWNGVDPNSEDGGKWTYAGALLYAVTVITTIGYGTITPKTDAGKALTILYALIGIPLTVLCITNIGRGMAAFCRALYGGTFCVECRQQFFQTLKTRRPSSEANDNIELDKVDKDNVSEVEVVIHKHAEVPVTLSLILVTWYIAFGAIMFKLWEEEWTIFEGAYFCFITLSTIGFGDFVPGFSEKEWDNQVKQIACSLYLLIGLATLAMCFDLLQQRGKAIANNFGTFIGLVKKEKEVENEVHV